MISRDTFFDIEYFLYLSDPSEGFYMTLSIPYSKSRTSLMLQEKFQKHCWEKTFQLMNR